MEAAKIIAMATPRLCAYGSLIGGIVCLGLSIAPIPTKQFMLLRTVAAGIGTGISAIGYGAARINEKRDREIAGVVARAKEEEDFQRQQDLQDKLAIAESRREAIVIETKQKEASRIEVAIADYTDDVRDAYVMVQDEKGRLDRCLLNPPEPEQIALPDPEPELEPEPETQEKIESLAAKKTKLLKLINEHEGGWIGQCMKKPILIYGDQGSGKSYFAEFLALCRHYLRGHQIVSIADPHFHQNCDECWKQLVKLGIPGFGAHHDYKAVNSQILAMFDRFATRTLKDVPITSIFDEVTRYGQEENTQESAAKLGSKLSSDPRKAKESPILVAHAKTLAALGGGEGFADAIVGNFIRIKLNSDSEQEPLWRGTISGIKDEDGEPIENMKISIAPDWIRSSWVYDLFNSVGTESISETTEPPQPKPESDSVKLDRILGESENRWLAESTPEMLDRLKNEWLFELDKTSDNHPDNVLDKPDNSASELSRSDNLIQAEIIPEALPRKTYPLIWDASDFARLLPNESESALFERILELSDKYKSASKIIQQGLGFTQRRNKTRSYSDVGKPCFKYLIRKYGEASLIAHFAEYLDKD